MKKVDKARTVVLLANAIRDSLLSNLNAFPEDWDGYEVRQAVQDAALGCIDKMPRGRHTAYYAKFLARQLDRMKADPDAHVCDQKGETFIRVRSRDGVNHDEYPLEEEVEEPENGPHAHYPDEVVERPFTGSVSRDENRAAHGGVCRVDTCVCGAVRYRNVNGRHQECSDWMEP